MKNNNLIKSLLIFGIASSLSLGCQGQRPNNTNTTPSPTPSASPTASATPSPSATKPPHGNTEKPDSLKPLVETLNKNTQYLEKLKDIDLKKMQADQAATNNLMLWIAITLTIFVILKIIEIVFSWKQTQMQNKYLEFLKPLLANLKEDFEKILNIPAKIDTLSSNLNTNLENITERLERLETKPSDTLPQKLTEIGSDLTEIKHILNKPKDINTQDFARQLIEAIKNNPDLIFEIAAAVSSQQGGKSKSSSESPKFTGEVPPSEISDSLVLTVAEKRFVDHYNSGNDLSQYPTDVSLSQETLDAIRMNQNPSPTLNVDTLGGYSVIKVNEENYLVPNPTKKLTKHQMNSMQYLFDFRNYQSEITDSKNFQLIKPAKVASGTTGEIWVLQERGILEFQ